MLYGPEPLIPAGVSDMWYWSELIVMLLNRERRALHDFIAGTIVVDIRKRKRRQEITLLHGVRVEVDSSLFDDSNGTAAPSDEGGAGEASEADAAASGPDAHGPSDA